MIRPLVLLLLASALEAAYVGGKSASHEHLNADHVQQVTTKSWLAKVVKERGNGILGGVILGCLLWCLVPIAIFNTERISAKQAKMRFKAQRYAIHLDDTSLKPLDELNGRIVYVKGQTECSEALSDEALPKVKSEGKIKLRRLIQMYQHVEKSREEKDGDDTKTVYYTEEEWSDQHEECPNTGKSNPDFPFESSVRQKAYQAWAASGNGKPCAEAKHENVTMGQYYLDDYVIREMVNWKDKEDVTGDMLAISGKGTPTKDKDDGFWYYDGASASGRNGAIRIKFEELCTGPITICGVLSQNKIGWSFLPIVKKDAQGSCDSLVAECGMSCCFSIEELHYESDDKDVVDELKEKLEGREKEFSTADVKRLKKSNTMAEENHDDDMDDLCCTGICGVLVKKFMQFVGLEDELLAVAEEEKSLDGIIKAEAAAMDNKVNIARASTFFCLVFATLLIINPIMKLLNYNWLVTMLGGGLLSCIICCCAMMFTCSAYSCLVTSAWIWYRPFLAMVALAVSIISMAGVIYLVIEVKKQLDAQEAASGGAPATYGFLAMREMLAHHM